MKSRFFSDIIFGQPTSLFLLLTCVLAGMLGAIPVYSEAPFLILILSILIIIFKTNILLALFIIIAVKLISYFLLPLYFHIGQALLKSFLQPIFKWLINAPLFAYAGLEHYAITGSQFAGFLIGLIIGFSVVYLKKQLKLQSHKRKADAQFFRYWTHRPGVVFIVWFLTGQKAYHVNWPQLHKPTLNPLRLTGVFLLFLITIILVLGYHSIVQTPLANHLLSRQLTQLSGAPVKMKNVNIELLTGQIRIDQLQFKNPANVDQNLIRAYKLKANVSMQKLLKGKMKLANVVITNIEFDKPQKFNRNAFKHSNTTDSTKQKSQAKDTNFKTDASTKSFQNYFNHHINWHSYSKQIQWLLNLISGNEKYDNADLPSKHDHARNNHAMTYINAQADALIEKSPQLVINHLMIQSFKPNENNSNFKFMLEAKHLATQPHLLKSTPSLKLTGLKSQFNMRIQANTINHNKQKHHDHISLDANHIQVNQFKTLLNE
jgi:uncharacterized protein (TIGR03546 family)